MKTKQKIISIIVLSMFMLTSIVSSAQALKKNEKEVKITTSAICGMCKTRIEEGLAFEKGIKNVTLDLTTKVVTVVYDINKTNEPAILKALNNLGYDANDTKANPEAYAKLPSCCKKQEGQHKCTHH